MPLPAIEVSTCETTANTGLSNWGAPSLGKRVASAAPAPSPPWAPVDGHGAARRREVWPRPPAARGHLRVEQHTRQQLHHLPRRAAGERPAVRGVRVAAAAVHRHARAPGPGGRGVLGAGGAAAAGAAAPVARRGGPGAGGGVAVRAAAAAPGPPAPRAPAPALPRHRAQLGRRPRRRAARRRRRGRRHGRQRGRQARLPRRRQNAGPRGAVERASAQPPAFSRFHLAGAVQISLLFLLLGPLSTCSPPPAQTSSPAIQIRTT